MQPRLLKGASPGCVGFVSDSGWVNDTIFLQWLDHFAKHAGCGQGSQRTLLILDNHGSHTAIEVIKRARALNVDMVSIPPHSSHKVQPLDKTFFGPVKAAYRKQQDNYLVSNPGKRITQYEVAELMAPAYLAHANIAKAVNGFRSCGIVLLNRDIFSDTDFAAANFTEREAAADNPVTVVIPTPSSPCSSAGSPPCCISPVADCAK